MIAAEQTDGAWDPGKSSRAVQGSGNRQAGLDTTMSASSGSSAGVMLKVKLLQVAASVGVCPLAEGVPGKVGQRWSPCTSENW